MKSFQFQDIMEMEIGTMKRSQVPTVEHYFAFRIHNNHYAVLLLHSCFTWRLVIIGANSAREFFPLLLP